VKDATEALPLIGGSSAAGPCPGLYRLGDSRMRTLSCAALEIGRGLTFIKGPVAKEAKIERGLESLLKQQVFVASAPLYTLEIN